jgi:hypothetical protein
MRGFARCAAAGTFVAVAGIYAAAQAPARPAKDAGPIIAAARQALGGEKRLTAVKSFTATGRTKQVRGENLVPIEFEIFVELPDKYVRKDEIPAQESGITASGFNGDELLQDPPPPSTGAGPAGAPPTTAPGAPAAPGAPPPGRGTPPAGTPPAGAARGTPPTGVPGGPPRNPSAARVAALKQDFARLTLGMFATSFSAYPLTFSYIGEAEAPQGKADVVDAKGPNNFTIRLFIAKDTHLPVMVTWTGAPAGRGRPGGPGAPGAERGAAGPGAERGAAGPGAERGTPPPGAPQAPPENRLYFADYRDVDGMQFPFRLRRAVGTDTIEETTFDRFKVNAKIDPKRFEVRK